MNRIATSNARRLAALALLGLTALNLSAAVITLQKGSDSYAGTADTSLVQETGGTNNYGGRTTLLTGFNSSATSRRLGLLRFDVSGLSGSYSAVNGISVQLTVGGVPAANSQTLGLFLEQPANAGWVEGTANGTAQIGACCYKFLSLATGSTGTAWAGGANGAQATADLYSTTAMSTVVMTVSGTPAGSVQTWNFNTTGYPSPVNTAKGILDLWTNSANNAGFIIDATTSTLSAQYQFYSDDYATVANRPTLIINATGTVNWALAGSGNWDTATASWTMGTLVPKVIYQDGDTATFADTAGGTITIAAGGVQPGAVNVPAASGSYTFTGGAIGGSATLTKSGNCTLTLSSANTYSGATTINGGTLALNGSGSIGSSSQLNLGAGGTFDVSALSSPYTLGGSTSLSASGTGTGSTAATIVGAPGGTVDLGSQPITLTYDGSDPALYISQGNLSLNGNAFTINGSPLAIGTYTIIQQAGGSISSNGVFSVAGTAIGNGTIGVLSISGANVDLLIETAAEIPQFTPAAGTYFGATNVIITCGTPGATIYYTTDGSTPTTSSSVYSTAISVPAGTTITIKAMATKSGYANSPVASATYSTVATPTWANTAGGSWPVATNWYGNVIAGGTGVTADFSALTLPANATVTLDGAHTIGGMIFDDQNATKHSWSLNTGTGDPLTLAVSSGSPVISNNVSTTIGAVVAGTQGLTINGTGTLTLTNVNTYTGNTTISAGTLALGGTGQLGGGSYAGNIANNGTLNYGSAANQTLSGVISGIGALTQSGSGNLTLSGANTYAGTSTLNAGNVNLGVAETAGVSGPLGSATAAGSIVLGGGTLQYSAVNQYDYSSRFSSAANQSYKTDTAGTNVTWATPLVSSGGNLTKTGNGMLTLTANNTFSGAATCSGGVLNFNGGSWTNNGSSNLKMLMVNGSGTNYINNNANLVLAGWVDVGQGNGGVVGTMELDSGSLTINGISGGVPSDRGLTIGEFASSTGTFNMNGGTLNVPNATVYIGQSSGATATWNLANGTANVQEINLALGSSTGTLNMSGGALNLGSGGIVNSSASSYINLFGGIIEASAAWSSGVAMNLTNAGPTIDTTGGNITLNGVLSGNGGLTKTGTGTLTLTNANTYTGNTTVSNGILAVPAINNVGASGPLGNSTNALTLGGSGSTGTLEYSGSTDTSSSKPFTLAAGGTGAFQVDSANLTLSGLIGGSGNLSKTGGGTLNLGVANVFTGVVEVAQGTLTCTTSSAFDGGLLVDSSSGFGLKRLTATDNVKAGTASFNNAVVNLDLSLKTLNTNAPLVVSGNLTNTGTLTINLLNVNPAGLAVGSYPLIKYGALADGGGSYINPSVSIPSVTASIQDDPANHSIDLVITSVSYLKWSGAVNNLWDSSTANWLASGSPTDYSDNQFVLFDDSGANTTIDTGSSYTSFQPGQMVVSNNVQAYVFTNTGELVGSGMLVKNGPGLLALDNYANTYTGGTLITGGTVQVGNGTTDPGLGTGAIENDGSLVVNVASYYAPPAISGTGSLTITNAGTLALNNANTYTGDTAISGGTVQMNNSAAFGTADGGTVLSPGTELDIMSTVNTSEPLTLGGTGISGGGALVLEPGTGTNTWSGAVTATANTTMLAPVGTALLLGGGVNGGNNNLTFQPADTAYFTVSSNLSAGTVLLHDAGGLFLTAAGTVTNVVLDRASPTSGSISPTAGITVDNSLALGTNSSVTISNANLTGNSGVILRLGNNVNIPAGVSLNVVIPGTGDAGVGQYRATFGTLGAGTTNIWNGPVIVHGADPATGGSSIFTFRPDTGGQLIVNGNITLADGNSTLSVRGSGPTIINGQVNWGTNILSQTSDGTSDLYINSTGNTWREYDAGGTTRLHVGTNNALPIGAPIKIGNTASQVDLNGFNQQIGGLLSTAAGMVVNNSTNSDSTLTVLSTGGNNWVFTGTIANLSGAKALNLALGGDTLTLTSAGNNYAGRTIVSNGAVLALTGSGNITASTPIDVQAGGTFDVSGTASGGFTLTANRMLMGNGTVNGSVSTAAGSILSPGESIGSLSISTNLAIAGDLLFKVNKALSPAASNAVITVGGVLTNAGTGTLTVSNLNLAAPLAVGDRFVLFNQAILNGAALAIAPAPGSGLAWTNNLALDGSISVVQSVATNPTNITFSVSGSTLALSWPADHLGWHLQLQTNSLTTGLGTNWMTIPGSDRMTTTNITIDSSKPAVFYRLVYP